MENIPWKGRCEQCGKYLLVPFHCRYCGKTFCIDHYHPGDHNCPNYQRDVWVPVRTDPTPSSDLKREQQSAEPVVGLSKKKIVAGIVGVLILSVVFLTIVLVYNPTAPEQIAEITCEVEKLTGEFGYNAETSKHLAQEVNSWTDFFGNPFLGNLKDELEDVKGNDYDDSEIAKKEIKITKKLGKKIKDEIPDYKSNSWELEEVVRNEEANCMGYAQLFFILGEVLDLQIEPVWVLEYAESYTYEEFDFHRYYDSDDETVIYHVFCLVNLSDGSVVFVELSADSATFSRPLTLEEKYVENGIYWEAKYKWDRDILGFSRIRLLDKKGLMSSILAARANSYYDVGNYQMGLSILTEAIEIDPKNSHAYNNRGCIYSTLGHYKLAIGDFTKAVEIDQKDAVGYCNRGNVYKSLFEYELAVVDFSRAIELNQKLVKAYYSRGLCYYGLGEYEKAVDDFDSVICSLSSSRLQRKQAYYARGNAHLAMGEHSEAERDFRMADIGI